MQNVVPSATAHARPASGLLRLRKWVGGSYSPYFFIAPFFILFIAFGIYPLAYAFKLSFTNWHGAGTPRFIGWDNYTFLLTDDGFWGALRVTGVLWLLIVPGQTILAILGAVVLSNPALRFRALFRTAFLLPFVTPLLAIAQAWTVFFDRDAGVVNYVLHLIHIPAVGWLTTEVWSKPTLALLVFWKSGGFVILAMLAAIQSIPQELYEAASIDGATPWAQFWRITVPLMRRTISFVLIIQTLGEVQMFAEPYVITQGGPYNSTLTAGLYLYNHINNEDFGTGAANSFLLIVLLLVLATVSLWLLRSGEEV